jgi:hypothetical protein
MRPPHNQSGGTARGCGGDGGRTPVECQVSVIADYIEMGWDSFDLARRTETDVAGAEAIGRLVRSRREQLGLSQRALGEVLHLDQSVISRLENGLVVSLSWRRLIRLVGELGGLEPRDPMPEWVVRRRFR